MSTERRLARAGFTLTRDYPAPVERLMPARNRNTVLRLAELMRD